jgi:membrane associated rhomboid family serine protease
MSRAAETLASVPPATRSILALCVLTYACQVLLDPPIPDYALNPSNILRRGQLYRLVSGSLFHANLMHIVMNAMSSAAIGGMLEKRIGTLMMLFTIAWGMLLTSSVYVLVSWLAYAVLGYEVLMLRNCVGFSGVIFQLSVLESNYGPENRTRSVFGMIEVSSKAYPWALLLALQFIMPQASFLGHLSGILVGTMQCRGALNALFPSDARLRGWEAAAASARLAFPAGWPGYVAVVPREMTTAMTTTTTGWRGGGRFRFRRRRRRPIGIVVARGVLPRARRTVHRGRHREGALRRLRPRGRCQLEHPDGDGRAARRGVGVGGCQRRRGGLGLGGGGGRRGRRRVGGTTGGDAQEHRGKVAMVSVRESGPTSLGRCNCEISIQEYV